MADLRRVKLMRGNESTRTTVIPEQGEQISTIDELKVYLGDGVKSGGYVINADNTITACLDQANVSTKHSLAWWIAWFNGSDATIRIPKGTHDILTNMTIPSNICLKFDKGAFFNIASGVTLTVNGDIDAGIWEVYTGDGTVDGTAYHPTRPEMPTPEYTDDSDRIATTAFVKDVLSTDPVLDGIPTAPTALYTDDSTQIATTAFVKDVFENSPVLDGIPTAPTADPDTNTTQIATTAYADAKVTDEINTGVITVAPSQNAVFDALALKADLDSPTLTGTPTAPTASTGTNSTQIATTEFVKSEIDSVLAVADALIFKGTLGTGGTITTLPTSDYLIGWTYKVITAGTYAGHVCEIGDMIVSIVDFDTVSNDSDWVVIQTNLDGIVIGPATAIDAHIAIFDGITGKLIKDSSKSLSDLATSTHVHGNITNDGKIGIVSGLMIKTSTNGELIALTAGTSGQYLQYDGTWSTPPDTDTIYTHPTSGVSAGTYTSVTVDTNGHVTTGTNPTTLSGYGITDAAPLNSPALTGIPTAPTATINTNNNQIATTAYADAKVADSITEDATTIAPSQNAVFDALALKADITSLEIEKKLLMDEIDSLKKSAIENSNAPYLTVSDYGDVTLAKNSVGVGTVGVDGVTVENLIVNGDFSNGGNGWLGYYGTFNIANNICTYTVGTPSSFARIEKVGAIPNFISGHKYLTIHAIKAPINTTTTVYLGNGWAGNNAIVADVWYINIATKTVTSNGELGFYCNTESMSVGTTVLYKEMRCFDLTALGLASLTATQLAKLLPTYFDDKKTFGGVGCLVSKDSAGAETGRMYFATDPMYSNATAKDVLAYDSGKYYHTHNVDADGVAIAEPYDTEVDTNGQIVCLSEGTVEYQPYFPDIGIYTDKFTLTKAITAVKELYKYGSETPITDAVIAGDGLSFTSASLTAGDLVYGVFEFNEPLRPLMTVKSRNDDATIADTANGKVYTFRPVITNGAIASWAVTEV